MYTRQYCSYCVKAKRLLNDLGTTFHEIPVDRNVQALQEMRQLSGRTSVPQIWIGDYHVGGCDELVALHQKGLLNSLLLEAC